MFEKVQIETARGALSTYLSDTFTETVILKPPVDARYVGMPALRVWYDDEIAFDYFAHRRHWWIVNATDQFAGGEMDTRVGTNAGMQNFAALVAGDIASTFRVKGLPISSDILFESTTTDPDTRAHCLAQMKQPLMFLDSLADGKIPFTDHADQLARALLRKVMSEVNQWTAEGEE